MLSRICQELKNEFSANVGPNIRSLDTLTDVVEKEGGKRSSSRSFVCHPSADFYSLQSKSDSHLLDTYAHQIQ